MDVVKEERGIKCSKSTNNGKLVFVTWSGLTGFASHRYCTGEITVFSVFQVKPLNLRKVETLLKDHPFSQQLGQGLTFS